MTEETAVSAKRHIGWGVVLFIWGLLTFIYVGYPSYQTAKESLSWPQVEGVVIESRIAEVESHAHHNARSRVEIMYRPEVVFQYLVDGKTFTSNSVYHMSTSSRLSNKSESIEVTAKYPVGASVNVYYKEDDPAVSVLEPGVRDVQYVFGIGSLVLMLVGIHLFINRGIRKLEE